jgi:hypothetical protein
MQQREPEAHASLDKAITEALEPGEQVIAFAEALVKVVMQLFNRCAIVLTDRRVILMAPSWPRGYKAEGSFPRSSCVILKTKQRFDGSTLLIIGHGAGVTCLYLSRPWQAQAEIIVKALPAAEVTTVEDSSQSVAQPAPEARESQTVSVGAGTRDFDPAAVVDPVSLVTEFHGIEPPAEDEDDF